MGFLKGRSSLVTFNVLGPTPAEVRSFIDERVQEFSFNDIEESYDEYSIGWVSVLDIFDSKFRFHSHMSGDYVVLSLRLDERKVPPAILKKYVALEERRVMKERQVPKLGRSVKVQIKERIRTELTRKSKPTTTSFELFWNLEAMKLFYFTTQRRAHAVLEDFFRETFGLTLRQRVPYTIAEGQLSSAGVNQLQNISPSILV